MIACSPITTCAKTSVRLSGRVQALISNNFYGVASQGPSSACCFRIYPRNSGIKYTKMSVSNSISSPSVTGIQTIQGSCFSSSFSKQRGCFRSLTVRSLGCSGGAQKRSLEVSLTCQNLNLRLMVPKQGMFRKVRCKMGPVSWPLGCASTGLAFGLLVCFSSSKPVHAEALQEKEDKEPSDRLSHGKKVYHDYSVTGIPGDGRCLFRSVAHGACLRSGKPAHSETLQRELADELRTRVADEFLQRRQETEWFVEGDFDSYVSHMRKPHVWGGEPELLMASHVLQMPITVYMYDQDCGGLISIAEYGQEYGKENPIRVLYHGYGHYDALQIPGKKAGRSRL